MKKVAALLLMLFCWSAGAQTILNSTAIDLTNPESRHNSLLTVDTETGNLVAFISDKSRFYAIRYNSAVFFKDSINTARPENDVDFIAGSSFDSIGNPTAYWQSGNYKKIRAVSFNFADKIITTALHSITFDGETYLGSFSSNNAFYIMSVLDGQNQLRFYEFRSGVISQKTIELPALSSTGNFNKQLTLASLFEIHLPVRIESDAMNPLFICAEKVKYYIGGSRLLLTADHNSSETKIFDINLETYIVSAKTVAQPTLTSGPGDSNSFVFENVLFQIKSNQDELAYTITDLVTDNTLSKEVTHKGAEISYNNSPLLTQTAGQPARTLKSTKRFLRMLDLASIAISAYKTPDDTLVTIGGISHVASTGNVLLGVTAGVGMVLAGSDLYLEDLIDSDNLRTVFFETHVDSDFRHIKKEHDLLAADKISDFTYNSKKISMFSVVPSNGYFIAGYYAKAENRFYLRKFTDGYDD